MANMKINSCLPKNKKVFAFSLFLSLSPILSPLKFLNNFLQKALKTHFLKRYCFSALAEVPGKEIMLFQDFDDLRKLESPRAAHSRFPRHTEGHPVVTHLCLLRHSPTREIQSTFPPLCHPDSSTCEQVLILGGRHPGSSSRSTARISQDHRGISLSSQCDEHFQLSWVSAEQCGLLRPHRPPLFCCEARGQ